mmetsp:Transcript_15366/g.36288  ORF Transcript_15366/g.36288 Transcript_15366/m.36288 type:complete len:258 (+) Transcript_15366:83-856(+)
MSSESRGCRLGRFRKLWQLDAVFLAPLSHDPKDVLDLWAGGVPQHRHDVLQMLFVFSARNDLLESPHTRAALSVPVLRVRVQALKHVEGLQGVEKVPHLITVVGQELQQTEALVRSLHFHVQIPGQPRLVVHDIAAAQPGNIGVLVLVLFVRDHNEVVLSVLIVFGNGLGKTVVVVEIIVVIHVLLDRLEVNENILKLFKQEKAHGHALSSRDRIAVGGRSSDQLEILLRQFDHVTVVSHLAYASVDDSLEDVLLRC